MKIILESLEISNFQSIGKDQKVTFGPGLWSIIGKNEDDGGSNGSGKSSFVRALNVGLLGTSFSEITVKEMRNRNGDGNPRIKLNLQVGDGQLLIDRTIGGRLYAELNGKEIEGKAEEIQEKIMLAIGLTEDQVNYLTNKAQGSFGGFLLMKDKEKKDFLGSFFNLEKLEAASDAVAEGLSNITMQVKMSLDNIQNIKNKISNLEPYISDTSAKIASYGSEENIKQAMLTHAQIQELSKEKETLENRLSSISHDYKALKLESPMYHQLQEVSERYSKVSSETSAYVKDLSAKISDLNVKANAKVDIPKDLTDNLNAINEAISGFNKVMGQKASLTASIDQACRSVKKSEGDINSMKQDTCTACGQAISSAKFEEMRSKAMAAHETLVIRSRELQEQLDQLNGFCTGSEIDGLTKARSEALSSIDQFKRSMDPVAVRAEIQELNSKIASLTGTVDAVAREMSAISSSVERHALDAFNSMKNRIRDIDQNLSSLRRLTDERERNLADLKRTLGNLSDQRSKAVEETEKAEKNHSDLVDELTVMTKSSEVLSKNGFLGYVFDSILNELNCNLNENLKSIPVASKLSLYFTPDKMTKTTKSMSKTISYKLFSGANEISFSTLSGGEQLSVILSVDEALESVLSKRLGTFLSWKVFDEQFFWVDEHSKESILDFLRTKATNRTYIIIDHAGEFNAAIDNRIIVTKSGGTATVDVCQ